MECAWDKLGIKRLCVTVNGQILVRRLAARSKVAVNFHSVVAVFLQANVRTDWELGGVSTPASPVLPTLSRLCLPHHCRSHRVRQETEYLRTGQIDHLPSSKAVLLPFILSTKHKTKARADVHATLSQPGPAPLPSTLLVAHLPRLYQPPGQESESCASRATWVA